MLFRKPHQNESHQGTTKHYSAATLFTLLISACILIATLVNIAIATWQQETSSHELILNQARSVGLLAAAGSVNGVVFTNRTLLERAAAGVESLSSFEWIIIRNANGDTLYSKNIHLAPATLRQGATLMPQNSVRTLEQSNGDIIVAAPVQAPVDAERRGEVLLELNTAEIQAAMNRSRVAMSLGSILAAFILSGLSFIGIRLISKTSEKNVSVAQRVTQGDLTLRLGNVFSRFTPRETVIVNQAFDKMLDSLEQSQEEMYIKNEHLQKATEELLQLNQAAYLHTREIELHNTELAALNAQLDLRTKELEAKNLQIEQQNDELQMMNVEKNEFLGIVAHDLKNPLSGIQGLASILEDSADSPEMVKQIAEVILRGSEKMFDLVKNLLDVNQLERGGRKYDIQPVNTAWLLMPVVESYHVKAEEKGITIHFAPPEEAIVCFADSMAFSQVLDNLVSNAVKYSPPDKQIWVDIQEKPNTVCIAIRDEGPGLSDDDKSKLFGKFARLSAQPTGGEHSTGLGLSIVKKMVEAMHGKVWCESELGKGATFFVEISRTPLEIA